MQGRLRTIVLAAALLFSFAVWVIPAQAGTYEERTFIDDWRTWDYTGNKGSHDFNGPWAESGDDGKSNGGHIFAAQSNSCPTDNRCLAIGSTDSFGSGLSIERHADTAGAVKIKFCFEYLRLIEEDDELDLEVQVQGDGGWVTLDTIRLTEGSGGSPIHWERDITGHAAENMGVRFLTSGGDAEGFVLIDTVEIWATVDDTTTTIPPTTTTMPSTSTTTTSTPPGTTTTSQPTGTTTTSQPTETTTTSQPAATTTTTSGPTGTTTTTDPGSTTTTSTPATETTTTTLALGATTTTTTVGSAAVSPAPPDDGAGAGQEPVPLTPGEVADYSSKMSMSLDDSMPMLMVPGMEKADAGDGSTTGRGEGVDRTPTQGLMATFSTSTETLQAHSMSVVLLGILVAWLAVRGLGRSRWGQKGQADVT